MLFAAGGQQLSAAEAKYSKFDPPDSFRRGGAIAHKQTILAASVLHSLRASGLPHIAVACAKPLRKHFMKVAGRKLCRGDSATDLGLCSYFALILDFGQDPDPDPGADRDPDPHSALGT